MAKKICKYGIDLGTTNSSVALKYSEEYGEASKVYVFNVLNENAPYLPMLLPSIVGYNKNIEKPIVGHEVKDCKSEKVFKKIKLDILKQNEEDVKYTVGANDIYASDILSALLKFLKRQVEFRGNIPITDGVIMGVPVGANDNYKYILLKALVKAGFYSSLEEAKNKTEFMSEPVAATLNYQQEITQNQIILVFDFGGGTLDVVLSEIFPDKTSKVLSKVGRTVGGEKLTELFFKNHFIPQLGLDFIAEQFGFDNIYSANDLWNNLEHHRDGIRFIDKLELCKMSLSSSQMTDFRFVGIDCDADIELLGITRNDFEVSISEIIDTLKGAVNECVAESGILAQEINKVYMAGGSSLIPCIQELMRSAFGARLQKNDETTLTAIARGLAIQGHREEEEIFISDISDFNYGVWDEVQRKVSVIIQKGDNILDTKINEIFASSNYSKEYKMDTTCIRTYNVKVFQDNNEIGYVPLSDTGSGKYRVLFEIDNNSGILKVRVYDRMKNKWLDNGDSMFRINNEKGVLEL